IALVLRLVPGHVAYDTSHHPARRLTQVHRASLDGLDLAACALHHRDEVVQVNRMPIKAVGMPRGDGRDPPIRNVTKQSLESRPKLAGERAEVVVLIDIG